jgi:hypothetical protein
MVALHFLDHALHGYLGRKHPLQRPLNIFFSISVKKDIMHNFIKLVLVLIKQKVLLLFLLCS